MKRAIRLSAVLAGLWLSSARPAEAVGAAVEVHVRRAPAHGLVAGLVTVPRDFRGAGDANPAGAPTVSATLDDRPIPAQFIPDADVDSDRGMLLLKTPGAGEYRVRLSFGGSPTSAFSRGPVRVATGDSLELQVGENLACHDPATMAGFPSKVTFVSSGKVFSNYVWNDRLYDPERGCYWLRHDGRAEVRLLADGPLCRVVRVKARYVKPDGAAPASVPQAVYDWFYLHDLPLVLVRARARQQTAATWRELHFLELNFPDETFTHWGGGEPTAAGRFAATGESFHTEDWGLIHDGTNGIGFLDGGQTIFHDGRGGYGTYMHAGGRRAWQPWTSRERSFRAWLWMGTGDRPAALIRQWRDKLPTQARLSVTSPALERQLVELRRKAVRPDAPAGLWERLAKAEALATQCRWREAAALCRGQPGPGCTVLLAGKLAMAVERQSAGASLLGLYDVGVGRLVSAAGQPPLFVLTLRDTAGGQLLDLNAADGWGDTAVSAVDGTLTIRWAKPRSPAPEGLTVTAVARADSARDRVAWALEVAGVDAEHGVWRVVFPQVAVPVPSEGGRLFVPRGAGQVFGDGEGRSFRGTYPSGWTSMQFMAAYGAERAGGLYVAMHDPDAHVKDLVAAPASAEDNAVVLGFDIPAPDMGVAGTGFSLSGQAVWQALRGDWFDAATIYRDWVRRHAEWYPELGPDGRRDSPRWLKELCIWGRLGGSPEPAVPLANRFAGVFDLPVGFHWYNWHQIPFDNDYPHYFPAKDGFREAVAAIQLGPCYVMPYINGRLWDTRDRGVEDYSFSRVARAAATKDEHGELRTEFYSSKEADGSKVELAAMCPATPLWRQRVQEIVLRLTREEGTRAVYIDQIAAAKPRLCFDRGHGHPLGGGGWWVKAYNRMLAELQASLPDGCVLTTECNAEPYLKSFDAYLTWHWQYDGQVPAFPAVYGGAIQMFGRAYRGGPTKDLALRMKAGEQLVFGEQLGWLGADSYRDNENMAFLRQLAWLRWQLRRYFYAGRMTRPPQLTGAIPELTADWQWHGVWPVTTAAVRTGAWELPGERRLALLFVNVSDHPVTADFHFDATAYGLSGDEVSVVTVTADGLGKVEFMPPVCTRTLSFPAERAWAWEVRGGR